MEKIIRDFGEVTKDQLRLAIIEMLDSLNISGSVLGVYDLYEAIHAEHDKAVEELEKITSELPNENN